VSPLLGRLFHFSVLRGCPPEWLSFPLVLNARGKALFDTPKRNAAASEAMTDLQFARAQMGMSLAFHIIFAAVGIAMPVMMAMAEGLHLRRPNPVYLELAHRWAKGTAILFAVGAVSGTVLSFELGLLWPKFMQHAGAIIGMPFSLEGFAFFTEAIFLGLFLYGWKRMSPVAHWLSGVLVAVSGVFSGIFVVTANAWMNTPVGFERINGEFINIDPIAAMLNPAALHEVLHMTFAALVATGFLVAGIHAFFLLRNRTSEFHRVAFCIAAALGCVSIPLQVLTGDLAARRVAKFQPAKLAAMEGHYHTTQSAPLIIGGVPDDENEKVHYGLKIPNGLSLLVGHSFDTEVQGLDRTARENWPNVRLVHWGFDIMAGCGTALLLLAALTGFVRWKKKSIHDGKWLLRSFILCAPLGFVALEAGWFVTEFGRQPWVIYQVMKTSEAVTPMPGLAVSFTIFTGVYLFLSVILFFLLKRQFLESTPKEGEAAHAT
jgi:cytochrome d ubiquinol oxidase subunit I